MLSNTTNLTNVTNVTSTPKVAAHAQHQAHALPDTLGGAAASTDILKNIQTIYQENTPQVLTGVAAIIGGLYLTNQINGYSAVAITILAGSFIVLMSNHATAGADATTQSSKQRPPQTESTADTRTNLNSINSTPITPTQLTTREETNTSTPVNTSQTASADATIQSTEQEHLKTTINEPTADTPNRLLSATNQTNPTIQEAATIQIKETRMSSIFGWARKNKPATSASKGWVPLSGQQTASGVSGEWVDDEAPPSFPLTLNKLGKRQKSSS